MCVDVDKVPIAIDLAEASNQSGCPIGKRPHMMSAYNHFISMSYVVISYVGSGDIQVSMVLFLIKTLSFLHLGMLVWKILLGIQCFDWYFIHCFSGLGFGCKDQEDCCLSENIV